MVDRPPMASLTEVYTGDRVMASSRLTSRTEAWQQTVCFQASKSDASVEHTGLYACMWSSPVTRLQQTARRPPLRQPPLSKCVRQLQQRFRCTETCRGSSVYTLRQAGKGVYVRDMTQTDLEVPANDKQPGFLVHWYIGRWYMNFRYVHDAEKQVKSRAFVDNNRGNLSG